MTTDKAPQDLIYLSKRLVQDIVDQHEATVDYEIAKLHVSGPLLRAEVGRSSNTSNPYRLARIAREATRDNTGTVDAPGAYLQTTASFTYGEVPVLRGGYRVAWFSGFVPTVDGEPALVALVGSLHNYVGRRPDEDVPRSGSWYPSAVQGLEEIFAAFSRDREEPDRAPQDLDAVETQSAVYIAHAIHTTLGQQFVLGKREVEVFARVFHDLSWNDASGSSRRLILGTPIIVQTPAPTIDRNALGARPQTTSDRRPARTPATNDGSEAHELRAGGWRRFLDRTMS